MSKTKIDWADYSWNPIVGCCHNCTEATVNYDCYAEALNNRFKMIPDWKQPQFFQDRIDNPKFPKKPSKIFVGSMSDVFGHWIPDEWIKSILSVTVKYPQHTFMFLTKNPERYQEWLLRSNCWLGATLNTPKDMHRYWSLKKNRQNSLFLSIEPLLADFGSAVLNVDLIIIGAKTGRFTIVPKKSWYENIQTTGDKFLKQNLTKHFL